MEPAVLHWTDPIGSVQSPILPVMSYRSLPFRGLSFLLATFWVAISHGSWAQEDCGFLVGPQGVTAGCADSCVWVVPDFERAAETTGYELDSIAYAPPLALGTGDVLPTGANNFSNPIPLPFGFGFYGNDFFSLKVNRRGFLTFNAGLGGTFNYPNQPLGGSALPPNSVMAPYSFISGNSGGGEIRTAVLGEFPCRRFVVSWENLPQTGCSSNELVTQVVLHETSNVVETFIGQFEACIEIPACMGIQGTGGQNFLGPEAYNTGQFEISNLAFRYSPTGTTQTEIVYLVNNEIVGQGDSVFLCIEGPTELIIGANFPEILPPPPEPGSCDLIPEDACDTTLAYGFNLDAAETGVINFNFDGELLGFAVTNNWTTNGGSWPGDMGIQICAPNGTCGFIEGFNLDLQGINLGAWPFDWNTTQNGFYESCFVTSPSQFTGDGQWSLTIQNGWTASSNGVNFNGDVTLFYLCNLEPEVPDTSAFMAMDTVMVQFSVEDQTAAFTVLDAQGIALDVLCSGDDPVVLVPETPGGVWDAECLGCLAVPGQLDPSQAPPGLLDVSYTIQGTCGEVVEVQQIQVGLTPNVNTAAVGALCPFSDPIQLVATPGGGQWNADCGGCLTPDGWFDPAVGAGTFGATYTFGTLCTASSSVQVNVGDEVSADLQDIAYCETTGAVQLSSEGLAGTWSADCGGCLSPVGVFAPPGPGTYTVSFLPGAGCGLESSANIVVDASLPIGNANVPNALCETAGALDLEADVPGGVWSSSGGGLVGTVFNPGQAPLGSNVLSYTVENGSCINSASFTTAVLPVLQVALEEEAPFCVNSSGGGLDETVDLTSLAVWNPAPPLVWTSDCGDCLSGSGVFDPGNAGVGVHTASVGFDEGLGCSTSASIEIIVAPSVDATIDEIPDICESSPTLVFGAADNGGTWTANCGGCLSPAGSFDPGIGPGNYTVTHSITDVCTDVDAVQITVVPQRDATILVDVPNDELCIGVDEWQMGAIWAGGVWDADSPSGNDCIDPDSGLLNLNAAGVGTVTVSHTLEGLCGDSDVHVLDILACEVELVNIFTPNGDGKNDRLVFRYIELYPDNQLTVYNRNGAVVFQADGYENQWNGDGASDGTHYFVLQLPEGVQHAGHLMIQR